MTLWRNRYLSAQEKASEMAKWADLCSRLPRTPPDERKPSGLPDPGMVKWCRLINEIGGICTIQSCAGHVFYDGGLTSGLLWLRLSRRLSKKFDERAPWLAARPDIEGVARLYKSWGQEIVEINFKGNEWGRLEASMKLILRFLRRLANE